MRSKKQLFKPFVFVLCNWIYKTLVESVQGFRPELFGNQIKRRKPVAEHRNFCPKATLPKILKNALIFFFFVRCAEPVLASVDNFATRTRNLKGTFKFLE